MTTKSFSELTNHHLASSEYKVEHLKEAKRCILSGSLGAGLDMIDDVIKFEQADIESKKAILKMIEVKS